MYEDDGGIEGDKFDWTNYGCRTSDGSHDEEKEESKLSNSASSVSDATHTRSKTRSCGHHSCKGRGNTVEVKR